MQTKFLLEFDGITCAGCISSVEKKIDNLKESKLLKQNKTTGNSIIESSLMENQISKSLESFEGCCSSCQISLQKIKMITGKEDEILLNGNDEYGLIKKQYKLALEKIIAKEEVACSEYCVCKTTDIDRFTEFSEAPSFSSIFNLRDYLKKLSYLHPGMSVIDFGCGTGHDSFQIAPIIVPGLITGIDVTPEMVKYAKETAKILNISNAVFHQSADLKLIKPLSQDLIFANNVFNLLSEKLTFLRQVQESLNADGVLVIADEFTIDQLPESLRNDPTFQCGGIADAQTITSIIELCRKQGFKILQKEIVRNYVIDYNNFTYSLESAILFMRKVS